MVPLYSIHVRRDAHTITPVTVPEYELPLIQEIFGVENVHNVDGKRVDERGLGPVAGHFSPSGNEYERFCAKYGIELVEQVFGKSKAELTKQINAAKSKAKKTKSDDTGDSSNGAGDNKTE